MADPDYFTLAELKALPDMSSGFSDARILAAAADVTAVIEREVGTSFIPRTITETHDGSSTGTIVLGSPYVLSVDSVTENGVLLAETLSARDGIVRRATGLTSFATGVGNVVVTYQAGWSTTPPADLKEAALRATRYRLLEGKAANVLSPRQTSSTNDLGGTVNYAIAGPDRPTGYPDVDAVIIGYRDRLWLPGIGVS